MQARPPMMWGSNVMRSNIVRSSPRTIGLRTQSLDPLLTPFEASCSLPSREREPPPHPRIVEADPLGRERFGVERPAGPAQHVLVLLVLGIGAPHVSGVRSAAVATNRSRRRRAQRRFERRPI